MVSERKPHQLKATDDTTDTDQHNIARDRRAKNPEGNENANDDSTEPKCQDDGAGKLIGRHRLQPLVRPHDASAYDRGHADRDDAVGRDQRGLEEDEPAIQDSVARHPSPIAIEHTWRRGLA